MIIAVVVNNCATPSAPPHTFTHSSSRTVRTVRRYRRAEAEKAREAKLEQKRRREEMEEESRVESWLETWNGKKVERADVHRKYLEQCLNQPETKEEKVLLVI